MLDEIIVGQAPAGECLDYGVAPGPGPQRQQQGPGGPAWPHPVLALRQGWAGPRSGQGQGHPVAATRPATISAVTGFS